VTPTGLLIKKVVKVFLVLMIPFCIYMYREYVELKEKYDREEKGL
jgi:hypothetical protein